MIRIILNIVALLIVYFLQSLQSFADSQISTDTMPGYALKNNGIEYKELIYIHTDRRMYLTGEFVRFKVYCLEKHTSKPSLLSKVAYVEIYNEKTSTLLQARIGLKNGIGSGEIYLPTEINTNNYIVRGYTRWMRNDGPEAYFHALLPVINPFKNSGLETIINNRSDSVKFYPEGGSLLYDVPSRVVFQSKNKLNNFSGKLVSNDSIVITEFEPDINGLGSFEFTPRVNNEYHVEIMKEDSLVSSHILKIKEEGVSLRLMDQTENFRVQVFNGFSQNMVSSENIRCLVRQKGSIIQQKQIDQKNELIYFNLNKKMIKDGVFEVSLVNDKGNVLLSRKGFKYSGTFSGGKIKTSNPEYNNRDEVILDLTDAIPQDNIENSNISISVSAYHEHFQDNYPGFEMYLLLDNSINLIGQPGSFFQGSFSEISESLNNLLILNEGKEKNKEVRSSLNRNEYIPEYRGPLATGRVYNKKTGEPGRSIFGYLSVPGKQNQLYTSSSKSDGTIFFELRNLYGQQELIAQCNYLEDSVYKIELDNPYSSDFLDIKIPQIELSEDLRVWLEAQSQNMQITNAYRKFKPEKLMSLQVDSSFFYGNPDSRYFLDDYTRFPVMEEVMREYISGVYVRKNKEGFHFRINDPVFEVVYENNPLMLLDGVPVFDADHIIALDPLKIEKIETIRQAFSDGSMFCHGIVSWISYNGDLAGYTLPEDALTMIYDGLQIRKKYYNPSYSTVAEKRSRIPDFRNVLYWSPIPDLSKDKKEISFYTSDDDNNYRIRINGISGSGMPFSSELVLEVK